MIQWAYSIIFLSMFTLYVVIAPLFNLNQITVYLLRIYYVQGCVWGCGSAKAALDMTCPKELKIWL